MSGTGDDPGLSMSTVASIMGDPKKMEAVGNHFRETFDRAFRLEVENRELRAEIERLRAHPETPHEGDDAELGSRPTEREPGEVVLDQAFLDKLAALEEIGYTLTARKFLAPTQETPSGPDREGTDG